MSGKLERCSTDDQIGSARSGASVTGFVYLDAGRTGTDPNVGGLGENEL